MSLSSQELIGLYGRQLELEGRLEKAQTNVSELERQLRLVKRAQAGDGDAKAMKKVQRDVRSERLDVESSAAVQHYRDLWLLHPQDHEDEWERKFGGES